MHTLKSLTSYDTIIHITIHTALALLQLQHFPYIWSKFTLSFILIFIKISFAVFLLYIIWLINFLTPQRENSLALKQQV